MQTHSIIITFTDTAVVWYPNAPYPHWHLLLDEGSIDPDTYREDYDNQMSATRFLETYAEGTD